MLPRSPRIAHATRLTALTISLGLGAQGTQVDWIPTAKNVVLDTEVTRLRTSVGWVTVKGGKFVFRNVTIPAGTTVRGVGPNPLIIVIAGTLTIHGELTVRGGDGVPGKGLNNDPIKPASIGALGGIGGAGGGAGGMASPNLNGRSYFGRAGCGPLGTSGFGGQGGRISCASATCVIASAGGGGSFATAGDPWFKLAPTTTFVQPTGRGAYGCRSRTSTSLPGGAPGRVYFVDKNLGNNFIGLGIDVSRKIAIQGELPALVGGSGGGGGGDHAVSCASNDPNFVGDQTGGGGGAGGGVICIIAQGPIILGKKGRIDASGGNGAGGSWWGSSNRGGGGGGGAGGLAILFSRTRIDIEVQGETYRNSNFDFPVSADGGVGMLATYGGGGIVRYKYDGMSFPNMNARPSGGLGIIQFMTPPGTTNSDGTNTFLDDNVVLRRNGTVLTGAEKKRYLAWRGFPNAKGIWVDDFGKATNIGGAAGDFRPTPILLPAF